MHHPVGAIEKELSSRLKEVLSQVLLLGNFPRTLVQIVLQAQGPCRVGPHQMVVSYLNAASAALLQAGSVPMRGVLSVVSVARKNGNFLVNPGTDEYESAGTLGFVFPDGELVWSDWHGTLTRSDVGV